MSVTLGDLRRLLDLGLAAGGPTVERLGERTVEGLAVAYTARHLSMITDGMPAAEVAFLAQAFPVDVLDLTDPGTARAVLVALALSYGLDPGPMGLGVSLSRPWKGGAWRMAALDGDRYWTSWGCDPDWRIFAPDIAAIPADQPAVALAAMVAYRLGGGS